MVGGQRGIGTGLAMDVVDGAHVERHDEGGIFFLLRSGWKLIRFRRAGVDHLIKANQLLIDP
jgi:hypothetical protein